MEVGKKGKVHVEDIVFLIRKDPKKYARVKVREALTLLCEFNTKKESNHLKAERLKSHYLSTDQCFGCIQPVG